MGLFADIQQQVSQEMKQARFQAEQTPEHPPVPITVPAHIPRPETPAPVVPPVCPMRDGEAVAASVRRIKTDTERITRRNMKDAVAAFLTEHCSKDPALARTVIQPQKTMTKCFSYINRKAREYAEQERRDNNITENGIYGCDVPDDLCYQWAIDYFTDPNADKEPEKKATQKAAPAGTAKAKTRTAQKKKDPAPRTEDCEQITLMEEAV